MSDRTYEMKFICDNCDERFTKQIPFGIDLDHTWFGYFYVKGAHSTDIICPVCGSAKNHKVMK